MNSYPTDEQLKDFGACCACLLRKPVEQVQTLVLIDRRTPYGDGWGCLQCHLPEEGAIAVLCNECVEGQVQIRQFIKGKVLSHERAPFAELTEPFEHRPAYHPELRPDDPVVLFDPEAGPITDSQFTQIVNEVMQRRPSRMPTDYPGGMPYYWVHEQTGHLREAILAYITPEVSPSEDQLCLMREYLEHYINAPAWQDDDRGTLAELRRRVTALKTPEDISAWLKTASKIYLDPL